MFYQFLFHDTLVTFALSRFLCLVSPPLTLLCHVRTRVLNLKNKGRFASPDLLRKFPRMVKQLELSLYKAAPSLEAYLDYTTLPWRLQKTKKEKIGYRTRQN
jgi:hypothetical protein